MKPSHYAIPRESEKMNLRKLTRNSRRSSGLSSMMATIVLFTGAITLGLAIYSLFFGVV
ncbi:MAG: hypothetical protein JRN67_10120 [Nitrososphaerota archaeon]|nr:hypothetical protein [Nitrososphaerota archaeon]